MDGATPLGSWGKQTVGSSELIEGRHECADQTKRRGQIINGMDDPAKGTRHLANP
jgi:hypothetical protein